MYQYNKPFVTTALPPIGARGGGNSDWRGLGGLRGAAGGWIDCVGIVFFVDNGVCLRRLAGFGDNMPLMTVGVGFELMVTDIDGGSSGPVKKWV